VVVAAVVYIISAAFSAVFSAVWLSRLILPAELWAKPRRSEDLWGSYPGQTEVKVGSCRRQM